MLRQPSRLRVLRGGIRRGGREDPWLSVSVFNGKSNGSKQTLSHDDTPVASTRGPGSNR